MEKNEICEGETYKNIKGDSKISTQIKNILKSDEIFFEDEAEYEQIKNELQKYKNEKEQEIEDLEKELKQLKEENAKYEDVDVENDDISLNEDIIEKLKSEILKKIEPEIKKSNEDIQTKIDNVLKNIGIENKHYIKKKFSETIDSDIKKWKQNLEDKYINELKKIQNQSQIINKSPENNKQNENVQSKVKIKTNKKQQNINNSNSNIQVIKNKESMNDININNDINKNNYNPNYFNNSHKNYNERNIIFAPNLKSKPPVNPNLNIPHDILKEDKKSLEKPKKDISKDLFNLFNNIFFKNKEQTSINGEKINEFQKENLENHYFNLKKKKKEIYLTTYFDDFIKTNVVKFFEKNGIEERVIDNLKYNIETISECFEFGKYRYKEYYYPQNNKNTKIKDRKKSIDAARRFREVFNVNESIIKQEELLKKLDKNDNNIYKVFQQMYG